MSRATSRPLLLGHDPGQRSADRELAGAVQLGRGAVHLDRVPQRGGRAVGAAAGGGVDECVCRLMGERSADRPAGVTGAAGPFPRRGRAGVPRPARAVGGTGQDAVMERAVMELIKHGHACVVLCEGDRRLVIDPGVFTDPSAFDGAWAPSSSPTSTPTISRPTGCGRRWRPTRRWRCGRTRRWPPSWTGSAGRVHVVGARGRGDGRGLRRARARGAARRDPPGDPADPQHRVPRRRRRSSTPVTRSRCRTSRCRRCCCRCTRPWSRTADLIDYVRAVHADQAYAVHDGLLNDAGLGVVGGLLGERGPGTPTPFSRLAPGDSVEL